MISQSLLPHLRRHDDDRLARQDLLDCPECGVVRRVRRVLERHGHLRPWLRPRIATKEQRLVPRLHLAMGEPYPGRALVRRMSESPGRVDVVAQASPLLVEHGSRHVHCADDLEACEALGCERRLAPWASTCACTHG